MIKFQKIIRSIINESYESDISNLKYATKIYEWLVEEVNRSSPRQWLITKSYSLFRDTYVEGPTPIHFHIYIQSKSEKLGGKHRLASFQPFTNLLTLYIHGDPNTVQTKEGIANVTFSLNKKLARGTIVHEITHFLDTNRENFNSTLNTSELFRMSGYKAYISNPIEYNAHFIELLSKIERTIENYTTIIDIYKRDENKDEWDVQDQIDRLERFLSSSYKGFIKQIRQGNWVQTSMWFDKLTEKYQKKFHRRLYKWYQGTINKLKKQGYFDTERR